MNAPAESTAEGPMAGLAGKAALVTGGASGIGAGIARVLAAAGAAVAIGDLDGAAAAAVARRLPGPAAKLGVRLDVTDRDATHQAVTRVEQELGPVQILVNNAGISSVAPFLDISDRDWDRLMGLTQALAKEVAEHNVTVNAVCPGVVRTPLWDDPDTGILRELDGETGWQAFLAGIPLGRPQSAEDIGHACAYLASDLAMNVTGEALNVSGGQQMH
jgi:meso-butanediol dehydrogenase/(S,S)-butanediol dehydrogenase/diacetyl reductase